MKSELLSGIESLRCQIATLATADGLTDAEIQKAAKAAKRKADPIAWMDSELERLTQWQRELAEDLRAAYEHGTDYGLALCGCLQLAEALNVAGVTVEPLQVAALAELQRLRVAVEALTDPHAEQMQQGRTLQLSGQTWPQVAEALGYSRESWPTVRRQIVDWDKQNGNLIKKGAPGRKRKT
jgi:septal ring factor EnvC (AmiA/AmiB activator)